MTQDEIIRIAREAGIRNSWDLNWFDPQLEAFAKLVAAKYEDEIQDLKDMIIELQECQE
jgi:hypothetical protein